MKESIYVRAIQILNLIEDAESKIEKMYEDDIPHTGYYVEYTVEEFVKILELTALQVEYIEDNIQAIFESNLFAWHNLKIELIQSGYVRIKEFNFHK